jgi:hypothetical protein
MALGPCLQGLLAGHFDLYWLPGDDLTPLDANDYLGMTDESGIRWEATTHIQDISGDAYGPSVIDGIYQGKSMTLDFVIQEPKLIVAKKFLNPMTATAAETVSGRPEYMGTPGTAVSLYIGILEAVPRTSTIAASYFSSGGNSFRFYGLNVLPVTHSLGNFMDAVPVRFRCYPFVDASDSSAVKLFKRISALGATYNETVIHS